jgi:hypothetical protein
MYAYKYKSDNKDKTVQRSVTPYESRAKRTGIPVQMLQNAEKQSGLSFDDVKVHYNSPKPAQLQALAYTQGSDVHIAPGQEQHLGHELGHVVQQKQGRVQPTVQLSGVNVNDNIGLENEADVFGDVVQRHCDNCTNPSCNGCSGSDEDTSDTEYQELTKKKKPQYLSSHTLRTSMGAKGAGGEAHHLIPSCIAEEIGEDPEFFNSGWNGILLDGSTGGRNPIKDKKSWTCKVAHREGKKRDHPHYTQTVRDVIKTTKEAEGKDFSSASYPYIAEFIKWGIENSDAKMVDDI